jgi:hypothetical protein
MRFSLTDVGQDDKSNDGDTNMLPSNLVVVEEEVFVLVTNDVTNEGPTDVAQRQDAESKDVGGKWLIMRQ